MNTKKLRVRFAPAPTGMMHLGNIRTALMNFLIARQKGGTFILRVEDTDPARNFDPGAVKIQEDLQWLGIEFDEGPNKDGGNGPYFQSERADFYTAQLKQFIDNKKVYRCFCTSEELDRKRQRQIALKTPPRYDRICLKLSQEESDTRAKKTPFIWRMALDHTKTLTVKDLSHGSINFEMKNFSDFPITRQDGSVTFMFANFVDDAAMEVTCAIRGEDHLSNTAGQAALYDAAEKPLPMYWHMPILCNIDGKKLSKRDFGFSLRDLKEAGFLPEAINNYLAITGGSYEKEIMCMSDLIKTINFDNLSTTGQIKYDVEKLRWINHKWLCNLPTQKVAHLCRPYLVESYEVVRTMNDEQVEELVGHIQQELVTLQDCVQLLAFYFAEPQHDADIARTLLPADKKEAFKICISDALPLSCIDDFLTTVKTCAKDNDISFKSVFSFIRYALTGSINGPGIKELMNMLSLNVVNERLQKTLDSI